MRGPWLELSVDSRVVGHANLGHGILKPLGERLDGMGTWDILLTLDPFVTPDPYPPTTRLSVRLRPRR